jgi:hypothetical protein
MLEVNGSGRHVSMELFALAENKVHGAPLDT